MILWLHHEFIVGVVACTRTEKYPPTKIPTHAEELLIVNSYLPEERDSFFIEDVVLSSIG